MFNSARCGMLRLAAKVTSVGGLRLVHGVAILFAINLTTSARAADCANIWRSEADRITKMICANPELEWLDRRMSERFRISQIHDEKLLRSLNRSESDIAASKQRAVQFKHTQEEWLKRRDTCETDKCLLDAYYLRLPAFLAPPQIERKKQKPRFDVVQGKGWGVCDAYAKFLNRLPDPTPLPVCSVQLEEVPGMKVIQGEELDIHDNLGLLYQVEQRFKGPKKWTPPEDYDAWKTDLDWRIKGGFTPKLHKITSVMAKGLSLTQQQHLREAKELGSMDWMKRILDSDATNAPLDTFLAYQEDASSCEGEYRVERSVSAGVRLALLEEATSKLKAVDMPTVLYMPVSVVEYSRNPYLISHYIGSDVLPSGAVAIGGHIRISRLQRFFRESDRTQPARYLSESFCHIFYQTAPPTEFIER